MITVAFMLWWDPQGTRNDWVVYGVEHVNLLRRQVDRHLTLPHGFVLVCDAVPDGLDPDIRTVALDRSTFVPKTRFAKLMLFRPDAGDVIGRRIFYLDLDTVICGSLDAIAGRPEPIVLWRHPRYGANPSVAPYNSSVILLDGGAAPQLWSSFPRGTSAPAMRKTCGGIKGEDQAWIGQRLGPRLPTWDHRDGIYSGRLIGELPSNARIVTFPGARDPGMASIQARHSWIAEHRR